MSYREGFLVFTQQPLGIEYSIPVRHIVKVSYSASAEITKLDFIDGSSEVFKTSTDDFYQRTKKEINSMPII